MKYGMINLDHPISTHRSNMISAPLKLMMKSQICINSKGLVAILALKIYSYPLLA